MSALGYPEAMPNAETLHAIEGCLRAFVRLCEVLGPGWVFAFAGLAGVFVVGMTFLRNRAIDTGWKRALEAKNDMIGQLNEQNREFRVQTMVVGGTLNRQEATALVYGEDRLAVREPVSGVNRK